MAELSRRGLLAGLLGTLTGWLASNSLPQAAATPAAGPNPSGPLTTLGAAAAEGGSLTWSASGLPAGVSLDSSTALASGFCSATVTLTYEHGVWHTKG